MAKQKLPLEGVRILELSHIVAGTSAGVILGDLGADIIKIEHPMQVTLRAINQVHYARSV